MTTEAGGTPQRVRLPSGDVIWVRVEGPREQAAQDRRPPWVDGTGAPPTPQPLPRPGSARDVGGRRDRHREQAEPDDGQISDLIGFTETVGGIAHSVRKSLARARPDHVEVEFGLEIDASTGAIISLVASAHAKASMKVKLGWGRPIGDEFPDQDDSAESAPEGGQEPPEHLTGSQTPDEEHPTTDGARREP